MNFTEYQIAAHRTCPRLGRLEADVDHMDMGIMTEIGEIIDHCKKKLAYKKEIDLVEFSKEIGDCSWYAFNKLRLVEEDLIDKECLDLSMNVTEIYLTLYDYVRDEFNENILIHILKTISQSLGLDYYTILDENIAKLRKRYPDGFNEGDALNRKDEE
jgi:NTP pyrophosphatase (non-canonical NTP hydrolase)